VEAAELASRAAVQTADCASAARLVDDEQRNTYNALDNAKRNISSVQQKILENERLHNSMDASVNHHNQEIHNLGQVSSSRAIFQMWPRCSG